MPSYDLHCQKCGNEFELFLQRFIRDEDRVCPKCGSTDVNQSIASFNMLIGSGSTGRSNTGPRMDGKNAPSHKYTKYRDPKYRKK
jgi:putative FmdB family regulatory protein